MTDLLVAEGISKSYRGLRAVSRASFSVPRGGIVGLEWLRAPFLGTGQESNQAGKEQCGRGVRR